MEIESRIRTIAKALDNTNVEYYFIGGASCGFYINDPNASKVRPTEDIDCVVEIYTYSEFTKFEKTLHGIGFEQDKNSDNICRWIFNSIKVDIIPANAEEILGFSNSWYEKGMDNAIERVMGDVTVKYFSLPYFLASKLEALRNRGNDLYSSRDFEDIVIVLDGLRDLSVINGFPAEVLDFVKKEFKSIINRDNFYDALIGNIDVSPIREKRASRIIDFIYDEVINQ